MVGQQIKAAARKENDVLSGLAGREGRENL
jgi:hypothetical protein